MTDAFGIDFGEASTWRGMVWIVSACGVALNPDEQNAIVAAGMAVSGLIGVFWKRYRHG